ncbi:hypothetical protein [Gracilimonas sp.]|uniref:hypothetical protein n=1 Tax=Gracilimonas sp. TaxID=1974203 RepID=UPI002870D995|nr:hypothetical protein [Gracilimonas sp.]
MDTKTINQFSTARVLQLTKRYVELKKRMLLIGFAVIISFIVALSVWVLFYVPDNFSSHRLIFSYGLLIFYYAGFALSSTMFDELNKESLASQFYTLPVKTSEKLLSAILVSYVGYTLVGLIVLYVFSIIIGMNSADIFTTQRLSDLMIYTILQAIFIFGAVYFKANNFLSTLVSVFVFLLASTLMILGLKSIFPGLEDSFSLGVLSFISGDILNLGSGILFTLLISAFFIWFTYLRLKNRQIA